MTKFLFDERWPRTIVGTSPVTVTTSGLTTTVAINTAGIVDVTAPYVWQLRAALQATSSADFHTYEASLGADLSDTRRNRWEGGGRTSLNDGLSADIKSTLSYSTLQMTNLYTLAATITG